MGIKYLTTEEVVKIHNRIIERSGGHTGIISYSKIVSWIKRNVI